ncbi:TIGR01440 family protein [Oceanobacillus massiliensis]|uniref:TIGR01440 family protein n=1 Tax=Oceanobacillus massiliensis TaxID=1465765 RepID=UPI00028A1F52|nr:TIGR01440 family protein [Oceanobacillus massiliensis]
MAYEKIQADLKSIIEEWITSDYLREGELFVLGCSTSEVTGKDIGTSGSEQIAEVLFDEMKLLQKRTGVLLAFQCCEHLNRALVVERETAARYMLEQVSVVPVRHAGGSMASHAYKHMKDPVVVESIKADAGMDIGETMIGMHLKHVAVPLRFEQRNIGNARVRAARTRPKLIGGSRANYEDTRLNDTCN